MQCAKAKTNLKTAYDEIDNIRKQREEQNQALKEQNQSFHNTNLQLQQDFKEASEKLKELKIKQKEDLELIEFTQKKLQETQCFNSSLRDELKGKKKKILSLKQRLSTSQKEQVLFKQIITDANQQKEHTHDIDKVNMETYKFLAQIALNFSFL